MTLEHPHAELSAYIDDALDPAARAAVDGHLVACTVCRAHLAQLRATAALVHALPDPIPSRRLLPRLAAPAWLAPLRTLMTLASGAAVFLFIASALVSNITFLASGGATGTSAQESRDTALSDQAPKAAQPASTAAGAPAPVVSPNAAFSRVTPTQSPRHRTTARAWIRPDRRTLRHSASAGREARVPRRRRLIARRW